MKHNRAYDNQELPTRGRARRILRTVLTIGLGAASFIIGTETRAQPLSEAEAQTIAIEAYVYFYPMVTMDVTRRQLINMDPRVDGIGGPMNAFVNIKAFPTADMKAVVRPNFDTLYSSAWLDLTKEPVVVSAPDTGGRYYLLPMLDMWSDVFASPGWRTTGTQAANFLIVPPGWRGNATRMALRASMRRHPMCGSSDGPRRTARRITRRSIKSKPGSRLCLCRNGESRKNHWSRQRSIRAST
ncbi:hypothetical protein GGR34_003258 [Microvirga flocculans]|uniref:DUF1254 domain-containing protein n=1 Tax=Microvirga flocculans TaxID=217168 RepID=A0A7W6N9C7_9HYPH|nr:hypothetical protein [Microvirga flocculans]